MSTRCSSQELSTKLTAHIAELAQATDSARMSESMVTYLEMYARFHMYSPQNLWLILMARPDATHVAGYTRWQSQRSSCERRAAYARCATAQITQFLYSTRPKNSELSDSRTVFIFSTNGAHSGLDLTSAHHLSRASKSSNSRS